MKKMMSLMSVAVLMAQLGYADVSQESAADDVAEIQEQMQELAVTTDDADATLLVKKPAVKAEAEATMQQEAQN